MKKVGLIILALIMLVSFTACGGKSSKSDDPNVGMWNAVSASMMDMTMDISEVFDEGASLELKENGKYELILDGEKAYGKWWYEDGGLVLSIEGVDFPGNVDNDILILTNMMDMGLDLIFEKEGGYAGVILPTTSKHAGYYVLDRGTEDGETITGDELRKIGFDYYVLLSEDGTAICQTDDLATGTWENGVMDLRNDGGGHGGDEEISASPGEPRGCAKHQTKQAEHHQIHGHRHGPQRRKHHRGAKRRGERGFAQPLAARQTNA